MIELLPRSWKSRLRKAAHSLRSSYIRTCYPFGKEDLLRALRQLGVCEGDTVIAHSSYAKFEGFQGGAPDVIEVLQQAVGPSGLLAMPTSSFTGSALEYAKQGRVFNPATAPSFTGLLTDVFRRSEGVVRSLHPTHSVAALGARVEDFLRDHHLARTPCGVGSPYYRLIERKGKILLLGIDISVLTFYHTVEELLEPEFPFSPFTRETWVLSCKQKGQLIETAPMRLFDPGISSKRNLYKLGDALRRRGQWRETKIGRLHMSLVNAADVLDCVREMARNNVYCYETG
jgi:aminoglycoside 3-N-acetyltransferase